MGSFKKRGGGGGGGGDGGGASPRHSFLEKPFTKTMVLFQLA